MLEQYIKVSTPDGLMNVFTVHPEEDGPFPAVIMYHNAGGLTDKFPDMARRLASVGYYVAVLDLYYRLEARTFDSDSRDAASQKQKKGASSSLVNAKVMADTRSLLDFLQTDADVHPRFKGCIGDCIGGRFAPLAAANFPDKIRATASLFGTKLVTDATDSPHLQFGNIQGELYFGFAELDTKVPMPIVEQITTLVKDRLPGSRVEIHRGADHGYAFPWRIVYQREAAERSWERIFAMFLRAIPPRPAQP